MDTYTLSVYSNHLHHSLVATGGRYNKYEMTCAANAYPLGTLLEVEYGGRKIKVTVNDRISKRFERTRIDLSGSAFKALCPNYNYTDRSGGLLHRAKITVLKWAKKLKRGKGG